MYINRYIRAAQQPFRKSRFSSLANCCFTVVPLILCMTFFWPFGSGGTKVVMASSPNTPAAHGQIDVKHGQNGNLELDIKTDHLATPASLTPSENVYVVWLQQPDQKPQNMGELKVDKNLSGELNTETAFKRFKVFISAEQNAQEHEPQGQTVLSADVAD